MRPSKQLVVFRFLLLFTLACLTASTLFAAPGQNELAASEDPLIVAARSKDFQFVPPEDADQKVAEDFYLEFASKNPNHPLLPHLYFHLGHMYTSGVDRNWKAKFGHIWDREKAYDFFRRSVELHPNNKISNLLMDARISAASLAPSEDDKVKEYVSLYKWLQSLTEDQVRNNMWLSEKQVKFVKARPSRMDTWVSIFLENRDNYLEVAETNMVAIAASISPENRERLLKMISSAFPNEPPGQLAEKELARLAEQRSQ